MSLSARRGTGYSTSRRAEPRVGHAGIITDVAMTPRLLRCAIEQLADWHPNLFVQPHLVAFVAVAGQYAGSPALFDVECGNIVSRWLGKASGFRLEVSWTAGTARDAERLRVTMQARPLVELAAVALALVLTTRVMPLGPLEVTDYGTRADYLTRKRKTVLEVSGTQNSAELGRRHREKILQARENPFRWDAYVVVCGFSERGHRIRFTRHPAGEGEHGEGQG
jgi:hypothetical protein